MYKLSDYAKIIKKDNTEFFVHNSLTGKIAKINNLSVKDMIEKNELDLDNNIIKELIEDKFIVDENFDEDSIFKLHKLEDISNNFLQLIILPTESCNFRCRYCYSDFNSGKMSTDTQEGIIKYVKKNIQRYSGLNIYWFGGEPLLTQDIIENLSVELIDICHSRNKPYFAGITTNGYYLTQDVFKKLLGYRINMYMITLDGFENVHDYNRKLANNGGTFKVIFENLRNIKNNISSGSFKIRIRVNVTKELLPSLKDFIGFLYEEFANDNRFDFYFVAVTNYGGEAIKNIKDSLLDSFDSVYDTMISSDKRLNYSFYETMLKSGLCYAGKRNSYVIKPNGKIGKCTVSDNDFNDLGYIDKDGSMILDREKLARWVNYKRSKASKCASCPENKECTDFACPLVHNFSSEIDCGKEFINVSKIVELLATDKSRKYNCVKEYQ